MASSVVSASLRGVIDHRGGGAVEHLARLLGVFRRDQQPSRQDADAALDAADVSVGEHALDARRAQHGLRPGQVDEIVAAH